ncbi:MAG: histidinol dehydrogenase [Gammaproteobacteria bacterium]|nr:histidinol dehydrogenase [Gammaproteobacteria bacterium]MBU2058129.1 histidinol dehydrogenase [Gammaproteobacteria bacterium]MBU2176036.1 histidinol dehydrogenase [Gammaproteobacteria bacterium]MBU2247223.1 histidinol dehydrogenase [Gammaproteobacteria bacterium]MBU2394016.1 histidinol dehydrogenase [Gammaproteobacteria bacterium]
MLYPISNWQQLDKTAQQALLERPLQQESDSLKQSVKDIISAVRSEGDTALLRFSREFDKLSSNPLRLSDELQQSLIASLSDELKIAIQIAYRNIRTFHAAQLPENIRIETQPGVVCELNYSALDQVGLYVPGGSAPLPSTVLMLGVPAQLAGCRRVVLVTPPGQPEAGDIAAEIVYAATLCGITEIYTLGGAQAIAALAYGTESIGKVDKVFGPGNRFVTEAKQQVSQDPRGAAIDMPAGPSEVLVIADDNANPVFVAADLLSQAEHGPDSQVVLVSPSEALLVNTISELKRQTALLPRAEIAKKALSNSRLILTPDLATAALVSNQYAPEHLIIQTADDQALLGKLTNAASIFVGPYTPESAGDYASGTNHVLPTYGYSRNHSSLSLADFYRRYTVQTLTAEGMRDLGPTIVKLAKAEGLDAHANAVSYRLAELELNAKISEENRS